MTSDEFEFDVAVSFAGQDREIAHQFAQGLQSRGIRVFSDEYEAGDLWGKDLIDHLVNLYSRKARYCVMLVSQYYPLKKWTNAERTAAQERAFRDASEYILPFRLDDTPVPGLTETTGYRDLRQGPVEEVVTLLEQKLIQARQQPRTLPQSHDLRSGNVASAHTQPGTIPGTRNKQASSCLLGAIAGDIIGSVYEFAGQKEYDFPLFRKGSKFTDDSVLTIAIADAILQERSYLECIREYALAYPHSGYGGYFRTWMNSGDPRPYNSFGNGSAMRVSAVGWAFDTLEEVLLEAERSAAVTHNHPEGIKGAQAAALCVYLARRGEGRETIKQEVQARFGYDLERSLDEIRPTYKFNEICQQTVPEAIIAFLESDDYEDAVRKAISLGGDADTLAAITGAMAEAYYGGVPAGIVEEVMKRLPAELKSVVIEFGKRFGTIKSDA